jgi:hypothetical protein
VEEKNLKTSLTPLLPSWEKGLGDEGRLKISAIANKSCLNKSLGKKL